MSTRKYIGVDLGTWYNTTNKTSIAVGYENNNKLHIEGIYKEYTKQKSDIRTIYSDDELANILKENNKQVLNNDNWNNLLSIEKKNQNLAEFLVEQANNNALIGIDAPFGIPMCLLDKNKQEPAYSPQPHPDFPNELSNPYIFDNSSRFVYEKTNQMALPPAGDKIGRMTSRMIHLIHLSQEKDKELNITKCPTDLLEDNIHTFEVFPTATLYLYIKYKNAYDYLEAFSKEQDKPNEYTKIKSYKNDNWNNNRKRMLELLKDEVEIDESIIESDDDYDAVICALTTYLIDKHGYIEPNNKNLFRDSFIYMPNLLKSL